VDPRSDRREQRKMDKKTRKKGLKESVKGREGKEDYRDNGGVEWKGEGRKAREVEISRRRRNHDKGRGKEEM